MDEGLSQTVVSDIASACGNIDTGEGTGRERLKSIATSVKRNDEIKELSNGDLSHCTPQTKVMAEKNIAERTASSTSVDDIITLDNNNNSGGYVAPYTLVMLIAITIVFAGTYSRGDGYKRGDGMTANKANYLWPFYLFLCGAENIGMPTFFPSPNAKDWNDDNSGNANYLEGCLYTILKKAMPLAMIKIMSGVLSYPVAIVSDILLEYFFCGYVDGDGSYSGLFDGTKAARLQIAIKVKDLPNPFIELMKRDLGCRAAGNPTENVIRPLNRKTLYDSHWFIANQLCSTIKRVQVTTIIQTAAATQMVNDNYVADETLTNLRCMQTEMLSRANNLHGRALPPHYYEKLFNTMIASSRPLAFPISGAGVVSADGGVGYNKLKSCHLFQSCEDYCNAFASAAKQAFEFDETPTVRPTNEGKRATSRNTTAGFEVNFSTWQSVFLILYMGSFDSRRKCQWLVFLLAVLIRESPDFATKTNVIDFLEDLIVVIREEEES